MNVRQLITLLRELPQDHLVCAEVNDLGALPVRGVESVEEVGDCAAAVIMRAGTAATTPLYEAQETCTEIDVWLEHFE